MWVHALLVVLFIFFLMYTWDIREMPGSRYFMGALILAGFWVIFQACEISSVNLETKLIWANMQYLPSMLIPALFCLYVLSFSRRHNKPISIAAYFLLLGVPLVFNILVWTFPGLVRQNVYLNVNGKFPTVGKTFGLLFYLMAAYNYSVTLLTVFRFLMTLNEKADILRKQIFTVIIAAAFPIIANILHMAGLNLFNIDMTPLSFAFTGAVICFGIIRFNLFKVVPVARSLVIRVMKAGMIVFDNDGFLLDINPAAVHLLKLKATPIVGEKIENAFVGVPELIRLFSLRKDQVSELSFEDNGVNYYYEVSLTGIASAGTRALGWVFQIYNITERKLAEDIIEQAAYHDNLTALPNKRYFHLLSSQELALAKMHGYPVTIAFVDIDNFKNINDTYGHDIGDAVLKAVTKRLRDTLRESDIVGRLGGDEFAVTIPGIGTESEIAALGKRMLEAFEPKVETGSLKVGASVSIGFSIFPADGENMETLLQKADKAMYFVKSSGKKNFLLFGGTILSKKAEKEE